MAGMNDLTVDWGVAHRAIEDNGASGDLCVVRRFAEGTLVAVLDGLGHGREAAEAVAIAAGILEEHPEEPPPGLLLRCHIALRETRGAALSMASINVVESTMAWLGVGNVEGVLLRANHGGPPRSESLLLRGGVVGRRLPTPGISILRVAAGDTLIFATDGVAHGFTSGLPPGVPPERAAQWILARHGKRTDDALVVVARVEPVK
jgi:hypothetical protein